MASLAITVQAAGLVYAALGGARRPFRSLPLPTIARPLVGAATDLLRLQHRAHRDRHRPVDARSRSVAVWNENFLWSAPSYFVGAGVAAVARSGRLSGAGYWLALACRRAPLYLTYRTYKVYIGRIEDEQRHVQEMSDLHLATIEALALAIDAKDQTAQSHIRRVQVYAAGLARALGHARATRSRASRRRRCCTTSASWPCPSTSSRSPGR